MTSVISNMNSNIENSKTVGFRKDVATKPQNGLRKDMSYIAIIDSHNNKAIRVGKCACLSDEQDSGSESGYRMESSGLSSDTDSSSEDDECGSGKMIYEPYEPEMFEHTAKVEDEKSNDDTDDCKFGQSEQKHIMREILHHGVELRSNIIDDFGGWDTTFAIRKTKPSKSNTRRLYKIPRTSSAFPRPSTDSKENMFKFKHYDDISEYIRQYRKDQSVKDNRIKTVKDGDEGLLVPDPYATKLKNNICSPCKKCERKHMKRKGPFREYFIKFDKLCRYLFQPTQLRIQSARKHRYGQSSIAENCDFLTVYSSNTKEKNDRGKEKDKQPSIILPRPRPSSLVYCPSHDSDDDGSHFSRDRPSSLIYYPSTNSRPILPKLRPSSYVYNLKTDQNEGPVIVTSLQRPESSISDKEASSNHVREKSCSSTRERTKGTSIKTQQRPSSVNIYCIDSEMAAARQAVMRQPRPYSDHPFVVRTLSVRDRSRMLNLAPVRNQESKDKLGYRPSVVQANISLDHYLNLVVPKQQYQRSNSNLTANSIGDGNDDIRGQKPALHKTNIQLNIAGPCDPWTPKFELKRSSSRGSISIHKQTNSAGLSRKKSTTPDSQNFKQWPLRPELTLSRANTYHTHMCANNDEINNDLCINPSGLNPPNVQRVYGQRFRCCERIHALISSDGEESNKKSKDRHIKLSVDNLKTDKTNPVSFGSFGIRKGMSREETSVSLSCIYKLKRERQRRFNISLVK